NLCRQTSFHALEGQRRVTAVGMGANIADSQLTIRREVPRDGAQARQSGATRNFAGGLGLSPKMTVSDRSLQDGTQLMKIAQISPLVESVPPRLYGGTERVVSYLTEELVALGHDVTLFASGDSITSANIVSCTNRALRLDAKGHDPIPFYM